MKTDRNGDRLYISTGGKHIPGKAFREAEPVQYEQKCEVTGKQVEGILHIYKSEDGMKYYSEEGIKAQE